MMAGFMTTLNLDIAVDEADLSTGTRRVLAHIRPHWQEKNIQFKVFTNGITNKLIGCWNEDDAGDTVLVRVYGQNTDLLIDRDAETANFKLLQKFGYAPNLYAVFKNGLAYEYVPGDVLDATSVKCPSVYPLVAKMMAKIHKIECHDNQPVLWEKVEKYLHLIPKPYTSQIKQILFAETFPDGHLSLCSEVCYLKKELLHTKCKVVFCHNDLLLANIIRNDNQVTFIDYEYAGCNYHAFDIGNHFAEFAGVSSVNYSNYPSRDFQREWLRIYLEEFTGNTNVPDEDIETLYVNVNKFALVSHVMWALWALVQAEHSTIDFDFIGYAGTRMTEYYAKKEQFLSLKPSHE